jgi:hypothetical protein
MGDGKRGGSAGGSNGFSAHGDSNLRATRRPAFDDMKNNGFTVNGETFKLSAHAYGRLLKKSDRKDIMPNDIKYALAQQSVPAEGNSVLYTNPISGTMVFVNPDTKLVTGVFPKGYIVGGQS